MACFSEPEIPRIKLLPNKAPKTVPSTTAAMVTRAHGVAAGIDIALLGVPMDLGVTNRNGSRFGPRAVRTIERIGPYDHVLKCAPFSMARIADIGDVPMQSRFDLALYHRDIEEFYSGLWALVSDHFPSVEIIQ